MAPEIQEHGFTFEKWVRDTFFDGYKTKSYTEKWDVAKESNLRYGGLPVSIKTAKYGSSIGLGDALRQFHIDEDFLLLVGFWKQENNKKRIVNIVVVPISVELWRSLWHPITAEDLQFLDATIKNRALSYQQARIQAQQLKKQAPFTQAQIAVNPKIDSKNQRRLQCSLGVSTLFSTIAPDADKTATDDPELFGSKSLEAFLSDPRVFKKQVQSE